MSLVGLFQKWESIKYPTRRRDFINRCSFRQMEMDRSEVERAGGVLSPNGRGLLGTLAGFGSESGQ